MTGIDIEGKLLKLPHRYPLRIGFIADLQTAGKYGMFPPDFISEDGNPIAQNECQKVLWKYLQDYIDRLNGNKVQILCVVGDLISGKNIIEAGAYTSDPQLEGQKRACAMILAYICEKVRSIEWILVWKGTPYHGSKDTNIEKDICEKTENILLKKSRKVKVEFMKEYAWLTLKYKDKEKVLFVAHPATSATVYPETTMGRDIKAFLEKYAEGKIPKASMIIRAHRHEYMELHKFGIRYLILPCWQAYVPYDMAVKWYAQWQPDIGGVIMLLDEEMRAVVWHFDYPNIEDADKMVPIDVSEKKYGVNKKCLSKN